MNNRDKQIISYILSHYKEMQEELEMIHNSFEEYLNNIIVMKAIKMDLLNIGENANQLSEESKAQLNARDLRGAIDFRNQIAHGYVTVEETILWETVHSDLPRFIDSIKKLK